MFRCFLLPSSPSPSLTLTHVGGLLVDFGLLSLRPVVLPAEYFPDDNTSSIPRLPLSHPAIVKWRAVTVIELPILFVFAYDSLTYGHTTGTASPKACATNSTLPPQVDMPALVLESATWKGGREVARQRRPLTGGPPIDIIVKVLKYRTNEIHRVAYKMDTRIRMSCGHGSDKDKDQ